MSIFWGVKSVNKFHVQCVKSAVAWNIYIDEPWFAFWLTGRGLFCFVLVGRLGLDVVVYTVAPTTTRGQQHVTNLCRLYSHLVKTLQPLFMTVVDLHLHDKSLTKPCLSHYKGAVRDHTNSDPKDNVQKSENCWVDLCPYVLLQTSRLELMQSWQC